MKKMILLTILAIMGLSFVVNTLIDTVFHEESNIKVVSEYEPLANEKVLHIDDTYTYFVRVKLLDGKITQTMFTYDNKTGEIFEYDFSFGNFEIEYILTIGEKVFFELYENNSKEFTNYYYYIDTSTKSFAELSGTFSNEYLTYDSGLLYFYEHKLISYNNYEHYIITLDANNNFSKNVLMPFDYTGKKVVSAQVLGNKLEIINGGTSLSKTVVNLDTLQIEYDESEYFLFSDGRDFASVSSNGVVIEGIENPQDFYIYEGATGVSVSSRQITSNESMNFNPTVIHANKNNAPSDYLETVLDRYLYSVPFGILGYTINEISITEETDSRIEFRADLTVNPINKGISYDITHQFVEKNRFVTEPLVIVGFDNKWVSASPLDVTDYYKTSTPRTLDGNPVLFSSDILVYYVRENEIGQKGVFAENKSTGEHIEIVPYGTDAEYVYEEFYNDKIIFSMSNSDGTYKLVEFSEITLEKKVLVDEYTNLLAFKDRMMYFSMFNGINSLDLATYEIKEINDTSLFGKVVTSSYILDNTLVVESYTNTLDKGQDENNIIEIKLN